MGGSLPVYLKATAQVVHAVTGCNVSSCVWQLPRHLCYSFNSGCAASMSFTVSIEASIQHSIAMYSARDCASVLKQHVAYAHRVCALEHLFFNELLFQWPSISGLHDLRLTNYIHKCMLNTKTWKCYLVIKQLTGTTTYNKTIQQQLMLFTFFVCAST